MFLNYILESSVCFFNGHETILTVNGEYLTNISHEYLGHEKKFLPTARSENKSSVIIYERYLKLGIFSLKIICNKSSSVK